MWGTMRVTKTVCPLVFLYPSQSLVSRSSSTRSLNVLRMQKALTLMNVQLHDVISDITGITGVRIIRAIVQGERNPALLASYRDGR